MKIAAAAVVFLAGLCLSTATPAGGGHGPRHGGVARELGEVTYELVVRRDSMTLYVSDHGKPVSTKGAGAEATVHAGNDRTTVSLEPAGENMLTAKGSFRTGLGVRVAVTVVLAQGKPTRLTFNLR